MRERTKYRRLWATQAYRRYSPAEALLPLFRQMVRKRGQLLDIGCGTARATRVLETDGWRVCGMDFVDAREVDVPLVVHDITRPWPPGRWDVGYCCDVLEHIPPERVESTVRSILAHCERAFFSVHFGDDVMGRLIGERLHLTVQPFVWWRDLFSRLGRLEQGRDLLGEGVFFVRKDGGAGEGR